MTFLKSINLKYVFIVFQVCNPKMYHVITWKSYERGIFIIKDQNELARLWGNFKSNKKNKNMDYKKFS